MTANHFTQRPPSPAAVLVSRTMMAFCAAKPVLRRVRSGEATLNLAEYAEYALMLAIVLTITLLTAAMIGRNSHHVISEISSELS